MVVSMLVSSSLACDLGKEEPLWVPETPKQYTAERTPVDVYVVIDAAGNVVEFDDPSWAYGSNAKMVYVLRFWDVGNRLEGYAPATIHKAYTPYEIIGIKDDLQEGMSEDQKAEVYARSSFPTTEVKNADLTFAGGPEGNFVGTNLETGKEIYGYMDWREKEWEMHACFYHDVMKASCVLDFLVLGEEPFYNWP
jgi:hypothetical protein